ncbi:MAG: hypothetical protein HY368_01470 [Candidatus Aenigmarchaeota archaeon]|nr:hypothetical protein [Candidatus Aenigmarchaeota archaeon]
MNAKRIFVMMALALVLIAAGCVQKQIRTDPNDGLKIVSFEVDPAEVESGDTFLVAALLENVGGTTARNAQVEVFGISWKTDRTTLFNEPKELKPPQPERNLEGGVAFGERRIEAPELPQGITHRFNFVARARYDYSTSAIAEIPVMSRDEFSRQKLRGAQIPTLRITNSNAPVKIDMTGGTPIIADEGEFFFKIHVKNTGSGIPITNDVTGLITGTVKIEGGGVFESCFNSGGGSSVKLPETKDGILLRRGESVTVPCSIKVDLNKWQQISQGALLLKFELRYEYYTEAENSLVVHGRKAKAAAAEPRPGEVPIIPSTTYECEVLRRGTCTPLEICTSEFQAGTCGDNPGNPVCCVTSAAAPTPAAPAPECDISRCREITFARGTSDCYKRALHESGGLQPFGLFCEYYLDRDNIVSLGTADSAQAYYECVSGCVITKGDIYAPNQDASEKTSLPSKNKCRASCPKI